MADLGDPHTYDSFSESSTTESETDFKEDVDLSLNEPFLINNEFMSEGEDEVNDRDWKIFPLVITAADDVCVKLNQLIQSGKVPRDKIFYKIKIFSGRQAHESHEG